jgi:tRNA(fMet)-specific endonuclease VapC
LTLRYLLDTNICIRVLRERDERLRARFKAETSGLCTSSVVLHELLFGAARSARPDHQREQVHRLMARMPMMPFDDEAADHAADIRADLSAKGRMIGAYDLLIAGHARSRGLIVVTGNLGEFLRVDGLRSENWPGDG